MSGTSAMIALISNAGFTIATKFEKELQNHYFLDRSDTVNKHSLNVKM